jgi:hypothetical protein
MILDRLMALENENKMKNDEIIELKKEIKNIKKQKQSSHKTILQNVNNGVVNNGDVNNGAINNIILVGYGKENIAKITKTDMLKVLQNGYYSTVKLTEVVHFNPKYHNVYISNMKDKYAMMFDGKNWMLTTKEDLINKIYEDKKNYIEGNLEEFVDSLPISRKRALQRWLDTDDDAKITEIKENIKLLLFNSRHFVYEPNEQQTDTIVSKNQKVIKSIKVVKNNKIKNCSTSHAATIQAQKIHHIRRYRTLCKQL